MKYFYSRMHFFIACLCQDGLLFCSSLSIILSGHTFFSTPAKPSIKTLANFFTCQFFIHCNFGLQESQHNKRQRKILPAWWSKMTTYDHYNIGTSKFCQTAVNWVINPKLQPLSVVDTYQPSSNRVKPHRPAMLKLVGKNFVVLCLLVCWQA